MDDAEGLVSFSILGYSPPFFLSPLRPPPLLGYGTEYEVHAVCRYGVGWVFSFGPVCRGHPCALDDGIFRNQPKAGLRRRNTPGTSEAYR
jgi:hypothetical protein